MDRQALELPLDLGRNPRKQVLGLRVVETRWAGVIGPNSTRNTSGHGQPNNRNAILAVWTVLALDLPPEAGSIKISPAKMALKLVFVLVGVGVNSAGWDANDLAGCGIDCPVIRSNLHSCVYEPDPNWRIRFRTVFSVN
jgi:hypothetical protein